MMLEIKKIRTDGGTQSRKSIDPKWVRDYAENMKEGAIFPKPVVFNDGKHYWLADGFHRVAAHKSNGALEVEVDERKGSVRDAKLFAIRANNQHGRNMTAEEKRDNIIMMIKDEEWGKWSDDRIAKEGGVSRITVFRIRKKLESEQEVPKKQAKKYVDKHGNESEMDLSKKQPKAEEEAEDEPEVDTKQEKKEEKELTADEVAMMDMTATIDKLAEENEKLKEQVALGLFEGNEFEKLDIQEMLDDLRKKNAALELEVKTLRDSRDQYQYENAQLIKEVKTLRNKIKKAGI
jgi:hypothetical protein